MRDRTTPEARFNQQRWQSAARGIEWLLTFDEWLSIWQQSGHWAERGCQYGQYVMSRKGDVGPYSVGNVFIQSFAQNINDALAGKPSALLGRGRGWTLLRGRKRPYQVVIGSKYIGTFATQAEAEAAYSKEVSVRFHECSNFAVSSRSTPLI